MVDVPVDDGDTLATIGERSGGHGDAVEQTEAHRLVGERMMARRPAGGEGDVALVAFECLDGIEHRADGSPRGDERPCHDRRVGIEVASAAAQNRSSDAT